MCQSSCLYRCQYIQGGGGMPSASWAEPTPRTQSAELAGGGSATQALLLDRDRDGEDAARRRHRLLNPVALANGPYALQVESQQPAQRVPFLDEEFAIDPDCMKVWELAGGGPLPETDGLRPDFELVRLEKPEAVCLSLTRACNLHCAYCYVRNRPDIQAGSMSVETALAAIRLCSPFQTSVSFFGGEPLLQFEVMEAVVREAERICDTPGFSVTTNATLLGDRQASFFRDHGFSVLVSVDGPPEIHNPNRPISRDGKAGISSYDLTLRGLEALQRHDIAGKAGMRSTFTRDCLHIAERLAHLNELCDAGLGVHVAVEPVSSSEISCSDPRVGRALGFTQADLPLLKEEYRRAFDWALSRAKSGRRVRWHQLNLLAERLMSRSPAPSECGAGYGYIGVTPDGRVFPCHQETGRPIGHVETGIDDDARACWLDNRLSARTNCPDCWCRFICGGACRADSLVHMGDMRTPYPAHCMITQLMAANTIRLIGKLKQEERRLIVRPPR